MAPFSPKTRRRQPIGLRPLQRASARHGTVGPSGWALAALTLLLLSGALLAFNQDHSGDRLKIRRELRKF